MALNLICAFKARSELLH